MMWIWIILFIIVGVALIALEVIAIPGTTVVGFAGLGMVIFAVVQVFIHYGSTAGTISILGSLVVAILLFWLFLRSKTWRKAKLTTQITSRVNTIDEEKLHVGSTGKTLSRVSPMGKALINGEIVEVQSINELIDEDTLVQIVKIDGNKITVKTFSVEN